LRLTYVWMMRASASRSRGRRSSLRGGGGGGEATPTSCSPATETRRHRAAKNGAGRVLIHCIALGSCPLCASLAPRCANADGRRWVAECSRRRRRGRGCQGWWRAKRGAAETRTCCACVQRRSFGGAHPLHAPHASCLTPHASLMHRAASMQGLENRVKLLTRVLAQPGRCAHPKCLKGP
jgi:hypothetical protein